MNKTDIETCRCCFSILLLFPFVLLLLSASLIHSKKFKKFILQHEKLLWLCWYLPWQCLGTLHMSFICCLCLEVVLLTAFTWKATVPIKLFILSDDVLNLSFKPTSHNSGISTGTACAFEISKGRKHTGFEECKLYANGSWLLWDLKPLGLREKIIVIP